MHKSALTQHFKGQCILARCQSTVTFVCGNKMKLVVLFQQQTSPLTFVYLPSQSVFCCPSVCFCLLFPPRRSNFWFDLEAFAAFWSPFWDPPRTSPSGCCWWHCGLFARCLRTSRRLPLLFLNSDQFHLCHSVTEKKVRLYNKCQNGVALPTTLFCLFVTKKNKTLLFAFNCFFLVYEMTDARRFLRQPNHIWPRTKKIRACTTNNQSATKKNIPSTNVTINKPINNTHLAIFCSQPCRAIFSSYSTSCIWLRACCIWSVSSKLYARRTG